MIGDYYRQDLGWLTSHRDNVRKAIDAVTMGKSVSIAGRMVSREDLPTLTADLKAVQQEIDRQNNIAQPARTVVSDFSCIG